MPGETWKQHPGFNNYSLSAFPSHSNFALNRDRSQFSLPYLRPSKFYSIMLASLSATMKRIYFLSLALVRAVTASPCTSNCCLASLQPADKVEPSANSMTDRPESVAVFLPPDFALPAPVLKTAQGVVASLLVFPTK